MTDTEYLEFVLDADRLRAADGPRPADGFEWVNVTACYRAADGRAGRDAAVKALRAAVGRVLCVFRDRVGARPPAHPVCVVLPRWWLKETIHEGVVYVDGCFTFRFGDECLRPADLGDRKAGKAWFVGLGEVAAPPPCEPESDEPVTVTTSR